MKRADLEHIIRAAGNIASFVTAVLRHGLVDAEHIQRVFGELTEAWLQHIRPRLTRCQAELLR